MKKMTFLFTVSLLFTLAISASAQEQTQDKKQDPFIYRHSINYSGNFKTDHVYLYNKADHIWQDFKTMDQFKCYDAKAALQITGKWVGNLSDDGQCLGDAEAPEWISGNYLNFRHEKIK